MDAAAWRDTTASVDELLCNPFPSYHERPFVELFRLRLIRDLQHLILIHRKLAGNERKTAGVPELPACIEQLLLARMTIREALLLDPLFQYHLQCTMQVILDGPETLTGGRLQGADTQERALRDMVDYIRSRATAPEADDARPSARRTQIVIGDGRVRVSAAPFDPPTVFRPDELAHLQFAPAEEIHICAAAIQGAVCTIQRAWPSLGREIGRWIQLIVPLAPSPSKTWSFNLERAMIGAIFLTVPADPPLFIEEAIVHETAHTILWTLMTLVPLIDERHPSATEMHEMPWSGNRRPFVTLLHGAEEGGLVGTARHKTSGLYAGHGQKENFLLKPIDLRRWSELSSWKTRQQPGHTPCG